jgi:putative DNA primase/helicase
MRTALNKYITMKRDIPPPSKSKPPGKGKDISGGNVIPLRNDLSPADASRYSGRSAKRTPPRPAQLDKSAKEDPPVTQSPLTKRRLLLQSRGYSPIPAVGKETHVPGWQTMVAVSVQAIERWETKHRDHISTGLLAGPTPGFDIDILNEKAAKAVEELVRKRFEDRGVIPVRIGQPPKRLIPFKTAKPFPKIEVWVTPPGGGKNEKIECLGAGQMYLESGIHPDTSKPYTWHGGEPGQVKKNDLAGIEEAEAQELVEAAVDLLVRDFGYTRAVYDDKGRGKGGFNVNLVQSQDFDKTKFALSVIPSDDRHVWFKVCVALINAERSSIGENDWNGSFHEWSAKSDKYDKNEAQAKWDELTEYSYSWTVATIMWLADQTDPDWRKRYDGTLPRKSTGSDLIRASDIEMRKREWLWYGHLLKGGLELLTGLPGLGKSQVQIDYVACVTSGKPWPDGTAGCEPANAIMLTAEDALDTEILPRLKAAGADLDRVYILRCIHTDKKTKRQFLLGEDLGELKKRIVEVGDIGLVTIDPITAYMGGKLDSHKATEVRSQLGPLKDLAEETNIAFSAITHPPKASKQSAIDSFIGSQAFVAAARVGHMCIKERNDEDEETGRVLYAHVKYNSSARMPTLAYQVEIIILGLGIDAPRVEWAAETVDLTADQALAASRSTGGNQGKVQAFIWDMLKDGPVLSKDIDAAARANDFSAKQVRTAKERLKVVSENTGPGTPFLCRLPGV